MLLLQRATMDRAVNLAQAAWIHCWNFSLHPQNDLRKPRLPSLILVFLPLHCLQDIRDVTDVPVEKQAARASADSTDTDQKMDQGPAKSDSTNGVGLVSNAAPLTVSSNHHFSSGAMFQGIAAGSCTCLLTPSAQWVDSPARSNT
jgi:hypothetical protein